MTAPLSEALRTATAEAHRNAEHSPFMSRLLGGEADRTAFVALTGQLIHVYRVLEAAVARHAADPRFAPLVDERLDRTARLDADLRALGVDPESVEPRPATSAYVDRLVGADAVALIAHHYVRYLGDLSGGQVIATLMERHYGLTDGLSFYDFSDLGKGKPYKDAYRAKLDALPLDEAERARVLIEAVTTFELNRGVFAGLETAAR